MTKISEKFDFGDPETIDTNELLYKLEEMYGILARAVNSKPSVFVRSEDGQTTDTKLTVGDINIDESATPRKIEMLTQVSNPNAVVWKEI